MIAQNVRKSLLYIEHVLRDGDNTLVVVWGLRCPSSIHPKGSASTKMSRMYSQNSVFSFFSYGHIVYDRDAVRMGNYFAIVQKYFYYF